MRQTSLEAYEKLKAGGKISRLRLRVAEIYARSDIPLTDHEVAKKMMGQINSINKRVGELIEMGVLIETGTRECTETGNTVRVCDITANEPKPLPKKTPGRKFWIGLSHDGVPLAVTRNKIEPHPTYGEIIQVREIK